MGVHRIAWADLPGSLTGPIEMTGEEAHHAVRVKRLGAGARVEIVDGRGRVVEARVAETRKLGKRSGWMLVLDPQGERRVEPVLPRVEVFSEPPKGAALEQMIDQLSQLGAASWSPLTTRRAEVDPRAGKLDRLHRTAAEASKQCGRAWWLEIGARAAFTDAIEPAPDSGVVVAHASGESCQPGLGPSATIRLIIGPVGDLTDAELRLAREAGARIASFGPLTMRIETAAVAGAAIILDRERRRGRP